MRNGLLITTAIAALIAGTSLAAAQGRMESGGKSSSQGETSRPAGTTGSTHPGMSQNEGQRGAERSEQKGASQEKGQKGAEIKGAEHGKGDLQKGAEQQKGSMQKNTEQQKGSLQKNTEEQKGSLQQQKGAAGEPKGTVGQSTQERPKDQSTVQERSKGEPNRTTGQGAAGMQGQRSGAASVQLSQDQRTRIKETVITRSDARVENPTFSISVGTRVPQNVHVVVLPEEVIRIVPEYRGFDYIIVRDEILIIDPASLEIVAVIPA